MLSLYHPFMIKLMMDPIALVTKNGWNRTRVARLQSQKQGRHCDPPTKPRGGSLHVSLRILVGGLEHGWSMFHILGISVPLGNQTISTGWWLGTFFYCSIQLGMSSCQLTNSIIFQRGRVETTNQE